MSHPVVDIVLGVLRSEKAEAQLERDRCLVQVSQAETKYKERKLKAEAKHWRFSIEVLSYTIELIKRTVREEEERMR